MNDAERGQVYRIHLACCAIMNCKGWEEGGGDWLGPFVHAIKDRAENLIDIDLEEKKGA